MSESVTAAGNDTEVTRDLTAFQQNILVILADEPLYGLAIKSELEDYYGSEVNHGRLYPNLDELVEQGLVDKGELDRRTNEYKLTDDGFEAILDQLDWTLAKVLSNDDRAHRVQSLFEEHQ